MLFRQKTKGKLVQAAPNIDLVAVVGADVLIFGNFRRVSKAVSGTAIGLTVKAVVTAICFDAIKPHQPGAALVINLGNFACGKRRRRFVGVGARAVSLGQREYIGTVVNSYRQCLAHARAVRRSVGHLRGEILAGLDIKTGRGCRRFLIIFIENLCAFGVAGCNKFVGGRRIAQQLNTFRQRDGRSGSIGRVFYLYRDGNNRIVRAVLLCNSHCGVAFV